MRLISTSGGGVKPGRVYVFRAFLAVEIEIEIGMLSSGQNFSIAAFCTDKSNLIDNCGWLLTTIV